MRILHTSDWHLGRILHGVHLTDDQHFVLDQFVQAAKEYTPDVVLIAGDIYDRSIPPPEAVCLLDETLSRLTLDLNLPVIMIAGNHDSPERINFGAKLLGKQQLHVFGTFDGIVRPVTLQDKWGDVLFYCVPYLEPPVVRERLQDENCRDHQSANAILMNSIRHARTSSDRSVLVTHAFVAGGESSESERPLSVGGSGSVDIASFADFQYVALGHLHRPQEMDNSRVRYSGSLMKYSFSEAAHKKSVCLVELDQKGQVTVEPIHLRPRRDMVCISGHIGQLLADSDGVHKNDFLSIKLLDEGAIFDAMGLLRQVYPNILQIERQFLLADQENNVRAPDHRKSTELQLFTTFFEQVTGDQLNETQSETFVSVIDELAHRERSSSSQTSPASRQTQPAGGAP